jgi:hypothetical protein
MKTLPLRKLVVPIASGSDPDVIEIDDCSNAVGDFPEIDTPCDLSPSGQCVYSWRDHFRACIHCKQESGLDE